MYVHKGTPLAAQTIPDELEDNNDAYESPDHAHRSTEQHKRLEVVSFLVVAVVMAVVSLRVVEIRAVPILRSLLHMRREIVMSKATRMDHLLTLQLAVVRCRLGRAPMSLAAVALQDTSDQCFPPAILVRLLRYFRSIDALPQMLFVALLACGNDLLVVLQHTHHED